MSGITLDGIARETVGQVRLHFGAFVTLTAAFVFLPALTIGLLTPANQSISMPVPGVLPHFPAWFWPAALAIVVLQSLVTLTIAAIAGDPGRATHETVGRTLARMLPALGRYLGALALLFLAYLLLAMPFGMIAALLAGALGTAAPNAVVALALVVLLPVLLWVGARLSPLIGVFAVEQAAPLAGIRRAWALSAGSAGPIILLTVIVGLAGLLVALAAQGIAAALGSVAVLAGAPMLARLLLGTLTGAANGLIFVLFSAGLGVLYARLARR